MVRSGHSTQHFPGNQISGGGHHGVGVGVGVRMVTVAVSSPGSWDTGPGSQGNIYNKI